MAIKYCLLRGDTHGKFNWMLNLDKEATPPEETAIIILGDLGLNFYLNKTDTKVKTWVQSQGYHIYAVQGNHESYAGNMKGMELVYDDFVHGNVYIEPQFPYIRYFPMWGYYWIKNDNYDFSFYIFGGAYSVDKYYRLARAGLTEDTNNPKKTYWFPDEQMTEKERDEAYSWIVNQGPHEVDFIFSHTCPLEYQPIDMFLSGIDQSSVDDSMERWLSKISQQIHINTAWCWGHYHADRIEKPHTEMYYNDLEEINNIIDRWKEYDKTKELPWYLIKGPRFDEDVT